MVSEQDIMNNFVGNAYKVKLKGANKEEIEFEFQQFDSKDLPDFIPIIDMFLKDNTILSNTEFVKKCLHFVVKMVDLSYPEWKKETKEAFINYNLLLLIQVMLSANTLTLTNSIINQRSDEELNKFVEEQRNKLNDKCVSPDTKPSA
ncbi:hypothetical protein M0R04_11230 [Candidatus Dojkabacteria bacterium]|jgi:hypothetical protein|nr:hypothetical protein [Candidatus Dojkabacteria bacterium]